MSLGAKEISLMVFVGLALVMIAVFVAMMLIPRKRKLALSQALLRPVCAVFDLVPTGDGRVVEGSASGVPIRVFDRNERIEVTVGLRPALPVALLVHSNAVAGGVEVRRNGWLPVVTGDASFSEIFFAASDRPDEATKVLTEGVRHHLLRLRSHAAEVVLQSGELRWSHRVQERGGGRKILELVRIGLEVAGELRGGSP